MLHRERPCERCRPLSDRLRRVRTWCRGIFQVKNVFAPVAEPSRTIRDTTARGAEVFRTAGNSPHALSRYLSPSGTMLHVVRGSPDGSEGHRTRCGAIPTIPKTPASRASPRKMAAFSRDAGEE